MPLHQSVGASLEAREALCLTEGNMRIAPFSIPAPAVHGTLELLTDDLTLDASMRADVSALLKHIGAAILVTALWLAAAVWMLRRKGVLP